MTWSDDSKLWLTGYGVHVGPRYELCFGEGIEEVGAPVVGKEMQKRIGDEESVGVGGGTVEEKSTGEAVEKCQKDCLCLQ